jgi:heptosyltransferase-2
VLTPRRILVIRPDRIGDVVLVTPLVRALRRTFPSAHIAAMVRPFTRAVLENNPHLDEILLDDPAGEHRGAGGFWGQVSSLRRGRFDTALLLLPTRRLTWILFFAGIRRRISVGRILYQTLTFTETVSRHGYKLARHEADYCLDLGRKIGVDADDLSTEVFLLETERADARRLLEERGVVFGEGDHRNTLIGLHPGHGGSSPNWRVERYVELADTLLRTRTDIRMVVTGGPGEVGLAEHFKSLGSDRVVILIGDRPLRQLMAVISHLDVLVSSSTGPMHLAAALKVPTVSLFCPQGSCAPTLWGPRGNQSKVVLPPEDFCQNRCPGDPHRCDFEGGIDVDAVVAPVIEQIGSRTDVPPPPGG